LEAGGRRPFVLPAGANYEVLPDLQPREGMAGWEFRSEVIWLTNCSIAVDLRIRGEFGPPALTSDDSVLLSHPRIGYVVAYGTAALVATVRGNDAWTRQYEQKALEGMDEIMEQLVRAEQGQVRRAGRQTRRRHSLIPFLTKEKPWQFQEQSSITQVGGERNFTVFIQLTFSGSFTTGGDPLNLATLTNPNGLDVEGLFELPLSLGPAVYLEDIGGYYVQPKVTGSTLNAFLINVYASRAERSSPEPITRR
jgi:hypothetical protein